MQTQDAGGIEQRVRDTVYIVVGFGELTRMVVRMQAQQRLKKLQERVPFPIPGQQQK